MIFNLILNIFEWVKGVYVCYVCTCIVIMHNLEKYSSKKIFEP